jgi:hypothetical protein
VHGEEIRIIEWYARDWEIDHDGYDPFLSDWGAIPLPSPLQSPQIDQGEDIPPKLIGVLLQRQWCYPRERSSKAVMKDNKEINLSWGCFSIILGIPFAIGIGAVSLQVTNWIVTIFGGSESSTTRRAGGLRIPP